MKHDKENEVDDEPTKTEDSDEAGGSGGPAEPEVPPTTPGEIPGAGRPDPEG